MRKIALLIPVLLALGTTEAKAWFFFFLPSSVTSKIGDAITGAEGDSCVSDKAKVGDLIPSASGNTATVKSLSGTSSRCQDPRLPVRALLTFNFAFASKAGLNVPDGFEPKPLTDMQRFQGTLLHAFHATKRMSIWVSTQPRQPTSDLATLARNVGAKITAATEDAKTSREEEIEINGLRSLRFEINAKNKGLFGARFTYIITVIQGAKELVVVNTSAPAKDDFEGDRAELRQIAMSIEGLTASEPATMPATAASAPAPMAAVSPVVAVVPAPSAAAASVPESSAVVAKSPEAPTITPQAAPPAKPSVNSTDSGASTATRADAVPATRAVADRLRDLDKLCKEGVLSAQDCEVKRKELIKSL